MNYINKGAYSNMDADTQAQLITIQNELNNTLNSSITKIMEKIDKQFDKMEENIQKLFNKDIDYLNKQNEQFKKWHDSHFNNIDKFNDELNRAKIGIIKETNERIETIQKKINEIENNQLVRTGERKGEEGTSKKFYQKYGAVLAGIGGISTIIGLVMMILSKI